MALGQKKTALQAAQERESKRGSSVDTPKVASSIVIGIGMALAIACALQAFGLVRERSANSSLEAIRAELVNVLSGEVSRPRIAVSAALDDNEIRMALTTLDEASASRARLRLRERLPEIVKGDFYPADLPELVNADLAVFGYARAGALAEARSKNTTSTLQFERGKDQEWLASLAEPIRDGKRTVAYAYVTVPATDIFSAFERVAGGESRIALRQGASLLAGQDVTGIGIDRRNPILGSTLVLVTAAAELFKIGDALPLVASESVSMLLLFAVLGAAIAALAVAWRRGVPIPGLPRPGGDAVAGETLPAAEPVSLESVRAKAREAGAAQPSVVVDEGDAKPAAAPVAAKASKPAAGAAALDRSIFRAYDIRGVVGKTLTSETAKLIGQAIGTAAQERGLREIVVGRDGRTHGPQMANALIAGLRAAGCDVIDIGQVPTPVVYFATFHLNVGSGVSVTGSHNPPEYNGFKVVLGGETLAEEAIQDLFARIAEGRLATGSGGVQHIDVASAYTDRIAGDIQLERKLKVVVDAGNGVAGAIAPLLLEAIGCEVETLYCEVDGTFPNHHPDPSDPENLKDLTFAVKQTKADIGFAFDGDGDRLGVVTSQGEMIFPDRVLMLFAIDVLTRAPGAPIIYDVKCTGHLQDVILRHGGSPIMWKTGHSLIKAKMREEDAELAGEMSGHFFFRERWYGFDDGIYAAARLAEILAASDKTPQEIFDELPKGVSTPELKVAMEEGAHYAFIGRFRERASFPGARITTIDGVRADYPDGWGLVRCSNTTPSLVMRFDADSRTALSRIQETFREQLLAVEPTLKLPF